MGFFPNIKSIVLQCNNVKSAVEDAAETATQQENQQSSRTRNVVELQGWQAYGTSFMGLPDGRDSLHCLDHCRARRGCRFVSYNLDTGCCHGFTGTDTAPPVRNVSYSLLAVSTKSFYTQRGVDYQGDEIKGYPAVRTHDKNICRNLCHIYPTCNVASYFDKGSHVNTGHCWLKSKTQPSPHYDPNLISYL